MYEITTRKELFQREKNRLPIECKSIILMPLSKPQSHQKSAQRQACTKGQW